MLSRFRSFTVATTPACAHTKSGTREGARARRPVSSTKRKKKKKIRPRFRFPRFCTRMFQLVLGSVVLSSTHRVHIRIHPSSDGSDLLCLPTSPDRTWARRVPLLSARKAKSWCRCCRKSNHAQTGNPAAHDAQT